MGWALGSEWVGFRDSKLLASGREYGPPPQSWVLTQLDLVLTLRQLLEVTDDGARCQVVEGLAPHVGILLVLPLQGRRFQLKAHLPLQTLVVAQAFDQGLPLYRAWSGRPAGTDLLL